MKHPNLPAAVLGALLIVSIGCGTKSPAADDPYDRPSSEAIKAKNENPPALVEAGQGKVLATNRLDIDFSKHLITFIELGADRCIPCKAMQPIMKEIAETFSDRVQVVFYDVWKDPRPGEKYGIQLIPTQVFVDQKGKEVFRHVGFFPKEEILELLKKHGIH